MEFSILGRFGKRVYLIIAGISLELTVSIQILLENNIIKNIMKFEY